MFNAFKGFGQSASKPTARKPLTVRTETSRKTTETKKRRVADVDEAETLNALRRQERIKRKRAKEEKQQELRRKLAAHKANLGLAEDDFVAPEPQTALTVRKPTVSVSEREAKEEGTELSSQFSGRVQQALSMLDDYENTDGAHALIYKTLLQTLVDLVPLLENNVRKSRGQKGAYQLMQTISQLRECMADIQAIKDKSQMGTTIVSRYVTPALQNVAGQVAIAMIQLDVLAKNDMTPQAYEVYAKNVNNLRIEVSNFMMLQVQDVLKNVNNALS